MPEPPSAAERVAALFAVDPVGLGGVILRARAGPARDAWTARLTTLLPAGLPARRVPLHIGDDRLLGGLDLALTLQAGRVVAQRGLLAEADGGVVWLAMAERLAAGTAARLAAVLDAGELVTERDGLALRAPSRIGVVALDEGIGDDEMAPARLRERAAFWLELPPSAAPVAPEPTRVDIAAARALLPAVHAADALVEGLCAAALALGIDSVRAPLLALRAARVAAALAGRREVSVDDAALAARLVLAPRATRLPAEVAVDDDAVALPPNPPPSAPDDEPAAQPDADSEVTPDQATAPGDASDAPRPPAPPADAIDDVVLQAALAAIPPHLLETLETLTLTTAPAGGAKSAASGRGGAAQAAASRGRPIGTRRAEPRGQARLNLIETLRAAAPWQVLRRREAAGRGSAGARVIVRRDDFHITRHRQRSETTTVFVVDASGSAALHRLAEAKGAVELLLADCYVRRDSVAVIAFRGRTAELLLPPTRSLARAKRSLAGLPGGGGTPLAAGIEAATALGDAVRRRGAIPLVVLLTDGRGNIALDGSPGRAAATRDAHAAAGRLRAAGLAGLVLDTAAQPQEAARLLAAAMGARYLPLPHAAALDLSRAIR